MLPSRATPPVTQALTALTVLLAIAVPTASSRAMADPGTGASVQLAQYSPYGAPPRYGYGGRPPCNAVNNPWGGAARGAAAGAIFGGIAGNAGTGAAIGAGVGLLGRSISNSNARANGYCY